MFGRWPTVQRIEGEYRGGPALRWLQTVLGLARDCITSAEYQLIVHDNPISDGVPQQQLMDKLERMLSNSIETLGSQFEKAIAHLRPNTNLHCP
jgi:hypothetical protein